MPIHLVLSDTSIHLEGCVNYAQIAHSLASDTWLHLQGCVNYVQIELAN